MHFEWDSRKDRINRKKHGIAFEEAKQLFTSGLDYLETYDAAHSREEDRFNAMGITRRGVVVVTYSERADGIIRIVSARPATPTETSRFEAFRRGRK